MRIFRHRIFKHVGVGITSLFVSFLLLCPLPVQSQPNLSLHHLCLANIGGGLRDKPSKFRPIAWINNPQPKPATESIERWILYHVFYENDSLPAWQTLIGENSAGECKTFTPWPVAQLPLSYFMGEKQANFLTLAKWQSFVLMPGGDTWVKQMLTATQIEPGQTHAVTLTAEDAAALKALKYKISPKVQILGRNWLPKPE
jgi:hypothetical protein